MPYTRFQVKKLIISFLFIILIVPNMAYSNNINDKISTQNQEIKWLEYEPTVVTLKGRLILASDYGAPNFGENPKEDKKEEYYLLELDTPINVKGDPKSDYNLDSFMNISKIQIAPVHIDFNDLNIKINKNVIISGRLFQAMTGHHHTKVLIDVNKIDLIENEK